MSLSLWPSNQLDWPEVRILAEYAEAGGWDGVWFSDHLMPMSGDLDQPVHECWTTLAALAAAVPRIRLGTLVSGNTYRHPALVAKMATEIDRISGGRMMLGIGASWQENEHLAYGIPFPDTRTRLHMLAESCAVLSGLLRSRRTDHDGEFYRVTDAPLAPKPVGRLPLLVGGGGERVTMRIAAMYADAWNCWGTPEEIARKNAVLDKHCAAVGRDPKEIRRSAQALLYVGDDPAALAAEVARGPALPTLCGDVHQLRRKIVEYHDAGVDELVVPDFTLGPLPVKLRKLNLIKNDIFDVAVGRLRG